MMKKTSLITTAIILVTGTANADVPVIDNRNYTIAKKTAETTKDILDVNGKILTKVEETLSAMTGDRKDSSKGFQSLAVGNGFSVSSMPSFDNLMSSGGLDLSGFGSDLGKTVETFMKGLQLVEKISGGLKNQSGDQGYKQLISTVAGVSALVQGTQSAVQTRTESLKSAGEQIGEAKDIKGSIDQNTQLQVQTGLTINELIGVMNGAVQSLQVENQQNLISITNSSQALKWKAPNVGSVK